MSEYKKFLIQQQTYNGTTYTPVGEVKDSYAEWGVVCKEIPFKYLSDTKELSSRDWHDEHGEDVYIPTDGLKFAAYDLEVEFFYVGAINTITTNLKSFVDYITGRNTGGKPMLAFYDEYTNDGRNGLYVKKIDNNVFLYDDANDDAIASIKVTFRVTDPIPPSTFISLPQTNNTQS